MRLDDMQIDDNEDQAVVADENDDEPWMEWNPAVLAADDHNVVPQHPEIPQHFIDLDLSGSSMRFLRATRPDITLDEVFQS